MMQRPHDALSLSPDEGAALIERLEHNALSAEDRCVLVQVVRWLFGLLFVVQEAKRSLKRLRTLLFGKGAHGAQSRAPGASSPSNALVGEGDGAGVGRAMDEEASGGEAAAAEAPPGASAAASPSKPAGGTGRARDA